uniref:SAP domain-containing protein n=1 Tax=Sciurus vulgaris TaxID=55149 RepID=A0A8D2JR62_SCIVU
MAKEIMEFCKLKLAELKQEFLGHGLKIKGIKHVLIKRLQAILKTMRKDLV